VSVFVLDNKETKPAPDPGAESATPGLDAWRAIPLERWYREVAEANPERVRHDGPCGQRFLCDRAQHRQGGYPAVELLENGTLVLHCEGTTLTANDPRYHDRLAALRRREGQAAARPEDSLS
jgi:hypothetical protein